MAIDKNSKAYNSLLNKGYTDEQITQMYDTASKQGTTKWVVPTTYDPMADLTPEYIANMDMNKQIRGANQSFSQYWDDSSRDKQDTRGWLNQKYTWEWVKTSDINYNPDITTKDLNPNFVYGKQSQVYGTDHPWYISQRNDDIASALYNEWLVSREDVTRFLMAQNWFTNSSEEDRLNTIESVWKRLWAIAEQNREKPDPSKAEELLTDTSGKIYGKVTADEGNPKEWIDTLADVNSPLRMMQESRAANLKAFITYNPADIAELMLSGTSPFSEQTLRDAQQYYPEFMAQVNAEKKKKLWQQNVNAIASGGEMTTDTNGQSNINNNINNFATQNATSTKSSVEITKDVNNALAESQTANEASETMASIEEDMAILKNRMKNLREEANAAFKWDVPDYLVNAYINNKAQEIQNQMSILEDRYNAAYQRYTTELQQKQWEKEYQLKEKQLALQEKEFKLKKWQVENWISTTSDSDTSTTSAKNEWDSYDVTTMSDEEVAEAVDELWDMFDNWQLWNAQCAAWIQKYYLPMLWIELPNLSSLDNKKKLINTEKWYTPKRWDLIILNSKSAPKNWHIGIVLSVSKDGYIEYMDWNGSLDKDWNWTEKVAINSISGESAKIIWFRNVNKGYEDGETKTSYNWKDSDYEAFENFLNFSDDWPSDAERKTIAKTYWFWDNLNWMYNFANEQLKNRKTWDSSNSNELGYDEELGYNPYDKEIYDQIISEKLDLEWWAKKTWNSVQELRRRVLNYQAAKASWIDSYDDGSREVDDEYWFILNKKMVYQTIANSGWKIPWTQKDTILKELWLNPRDPKAWDKALSETAKWQERQKQELDSQALDSLRAVEYIIMQDATRPQRLLAVNAWNKDTWYWALDILWWIDRALSWEAASWENSYNYIRDKLTLDYLVDLKNRWATFWALSNQELEAIGNAASLVMYSDETNRFRYNVNNLYNELRKSLWYNELSEEELNKMWNAEDSLNFDNYITLSKDPKKKRWTQNIKPQRNVWTDVSNRRSEESWWNWANVLDDVLNN